MIVAPARQPGAPQRVIRVFVSSTFRDMTEEREELIKRVFPQLRKRCEARGVTWSEVDLRWGVTDEQRAEGQVLPVCLAEIRNCRPYFIGILGERYGWVPDEIPTALIEREPWLAAHRGRSVTELEILHGVLNDPAMAGHAFFYLRDPAYIDSLPVEARNACREGPTPDELQQLGADAAAVRAATRREKLAALKARLRRSTFPVRENYPTPQSLGELVLDDLGEVVDRLFPANETVDPLDRDAAEHAAFGASRTRVYIGRQDYFEGLDAHTEHGDGLLLVTGEPGSGKSALLANWVSRAAAAPDAARWLIVTHFIGSTAQSSDWRAMVRRIIAEIDRRFEIREPISDDAESLRIAFANRLAMASARGRVLIVLDALDQLEDREGALDLVWLPPAIPANVRIVASSVAGRPTEALESRAPSILRVLPLDLDERRRLIVEYLEQHRKTLSPARVERIAAAEPAASPIYLGALLEELRLHGDHETLDATIDHYLGAPRADLLYERILARCERDYERDRPGLVRDALSFIWAARRGLSEAELLDLLGSGGTPLPSAHWSAFYLAAERALVNRSGLIGFFHRYLSQAVEQRYLPHDGERRAAHLRLARYFHDRPIGRRTIEELPWQLAQGEWWDRLAALLTDATFFEPAWELNRHDVDAHWALLEQRSAHRVADAYRAIAEDPERNPAHAFNVAALLSGHGHRDEALMILRGLGSDRLARGDLQNAAIVFGAVGDLLRNRGDLDAALALHLEEAETGRRLGDALMVARGLGNQGLIHRARAAFDEAVACFRAAEDIFREQRAFSEAANCQDNLGVIREAALDLEAAKAHYRDAERLYRETGDVRGLARVLGHRANVHALEGDSGAAKALREEEERLFRAVGDRAGLAVALHNQATTAVMTPPRDLPRAWSLERAAQEIAEALNDPALLLETLEGQLLIRQVTGIRDEYRAAHGTDADDQYVDAWLAATLWPTRRADTELDADLVLVEEIVSLCRRVENRSLETVTLMYLAQLRHARGDTRGALIAQRERAALCELLGQSRDVTISVAHQMYLIEAIAVAGGDDALEAIGGAAATWQLSEQSRSVPPDPSAPLHTQLALSYLRETTSPVPRLLDTRTATEAQNAGDLVRLRDVLARQEEGFLRLRPLPWLFHMATGWLATSLRNQATVFTNAGDHQAALDALRREETVYRGSMAGAPELPDNLDRQWRLLWNQGKIGEALEVARERLKITRTLADPAAIVDSLVLLSSHPGASDAEHAEWTQEALALARQHGLTEQLRQLELKARLLGSLEDSPEKKSWWQFWK